MNHIAYGKASAQAPPVQLGFFDGFFFPVKKKTFAQVKLKQTMRFMKKYSLRKTSIRRNTDRWDWYIYL